MARTIHSKGNRRHEEANAGAAGIYPGMLLEKNSSGVYIQHATEGERTAIIIAEEDALQGRTVDTVYTLADPVMAGHYEKGSEVRVLVASGENVAIGDELISAGDGTWKKLDNASSGVTGIALAKAEEAADLSDSGDVDTLVKATII